MHDSQWNFAERIEWLAQRDIFAAAPVDIEGQLGLRCVSLDGTLVTAAPAVDDIVLNRVIGLGATAAATDHQIASIRDFYASAGVGRYFVHAGPGPRPGDLQMRLEAHGFERYHRNWSVFVRGPEPVAPVESSLAVRTLSTEHAAVFGDIVAAAFGLPASCAPWLAALVGRSGWHVYGGFDGDAVGAVGALFVAGDIGWLGFGATRPELRRRRGQLAVMARRLERARELGCRWVVTETGDEVQGQPNPSFNNILRSGFERVYTRPNFVPSQPSTQGE